MALIKLDVTKRMLLSHTHTSEACRDEHIAMNASETIRGRQAGSDVTHTHVERRGDQHLLCHYFLSEKKEECEGAWGWLIVQHSKKHEDQKRGVKKMKLTLRLEKCEWQHHDVTEAL